MATVTAGGTTLLTIQRGLEPIEHKHVPVGSLPPVPVVDAPSPTTRFLSLLHETLRPSLYVLPRGSQGILIDPLWTIAVIFRLGDPNAWLLSPITQESLIRIVPSPNPNDLTDLPSETGGLTYLAPLVSSTATCGLSDREEEPKVKYLCTITRDGWSPHLEVLVKRDREEEQVPEEVPRKKQRVQRKKLLL